MQQDTSKLEIKPFGVEYLEEIAIVDAEVFGGGTCVTSDLMTGGNCDNMSGCGCDDGCC